MSGWYRSNILEPSLQNRRNFFAYFWRTEGKARRARSASYVRGEDPLLARNWRFALVSLSPLFPLNTQKITPVLQAIWSQAAGVVAIHEGDGCYQKFSKRI